MRFLITAGPTREPIDPVRYIGNRSSGRMGAAIAAAAIGRGHAVTLVLGPVTVEMPKEAGRVDVETARQMHDAVLATFPSCDVLVMAAAVADYRPVVVAPTKLAREGAGAITIACEPTADILAAASALKRPNQRTVGFSLEHRGDLARAREKLRRKNLDLIVFNPTETMNADTVDATLVYPDGRADALGSRTKAAFADELVERVVSLF